MPSTRTIRDKTAVFGYIMEDWTDRQDRWHRLDGPAVTLSVGGIVRQEEYFVYGERHSLDYPAYIEYYPDGKRKRELWYKHGSLHSNTNPTSVEYNTDGSIQEMKWFFNGQEYTMEDWIESSGISDSDLVALKLTL